MKVMIVVTHLLGTGHLARALTLARAYQSSGHDVTIASGGMPAPHLDQGDVSVLQLPPVRSDGVNFTDLLDETGARLSETLMAARIKHLLNQITSNPPDVLITELFPFGRRILRTEFESLLKAANAAPTRPLICASIRDILAPPSKPTKVELADALIAQYYDAVLVHSDRDVSPLELSWPVSDMLANKLRYTGFVAPAAPNPHPKGIGANEVIVSAGGGDVGADIFAAAVQAAGLDQNRTWRILVGGTDARTRIKNLSNSAPSNVIIEAARPDFRQMLHHASASVSMCGYNTALDILQTGCPAVFIPFDEGNEVEQQLRADALAKLPGIKVLRSAELTADRLMSVLVKVSSAPCRKPRQEGFDGATRTVEITTQLRAALT
ncbi:MAG: glycosyltransferase [Sulfitobacter sp.]